MDLMPVQLLNAESPIDVIPSPITTEVIAVLLAKAEAFIAPLPLTVSTPLSSSEYVALVPQEPVVVSALALSENAPNTVISITSVKSMLVIFIVFMLFPPNRVLCG